MNHVDSNGLTALHWAALNGHLEVVKLLVESGADVDHVSEKGWTALHCAAYNGHLEVVKLLVESGADVHQEAKIVDRFLCFFSVFCVFFPES